MAMSRTALSYVSCSHRGSSGAGCGPMYAKMSPPSSSHRVAGDLHLLLEAAVRVHGLLERLLDALAGLVHHPAVVHAAQSVLLRYAVGEVDAAVGAEAVDESERAGLVAVQHEVLAEEPHGLRGLLHQLAGRGDGVPVASHQLAHRRAGADLGQAFVLVGWNHGGVASCGVGVWCAWRWHGVYEWARGGVNDKALLTRDVQTSRITNCDERDTRAICPGTRA